MKFVEIVLGCVVGLILAGLVLWLLARAVRGNRSGITQKNISTWFQRRR